ncbi:hypothetical protein Hanom_Chr13g01184151 [Helianthus anomalus]
MMSESMSPEESMIGENGNVEDEELEDGELKEGDEASPEKEVQGSPVIEKAPKEVEGTKLNGRVHGKPDTMHVMHGLHGNQERETLGNQEREKAADIGTKDGEKADEYGGGAQKENFECLSPMETNSVMGLDPGTQSRKRPRRARSPQVWCPEENRGEQPMFSHIRNLERLFDLNKETQQMESATEMPYSQEQLPDTGVLGENQNVSNDNDVANRGFGDRGPEARDTPGEVNQIQMEVRGVQDEVNNTKTVGK